MGCADPQVRAVLERTTGDGVDVLVEELLRLQPPIRGLFRTTSEPVVVAGTEIPPGAKVDLLFAAANRDPREWDHPDEVQLDRDAAQARRHLSFGGGPHACVGAPLARLELQIALPLLFQRLPGLRLDPDSPGVRQQHLTHRGWASLPVRWEPPAA
jgi:cytochrome P450